MVSFNISESEETLEVMDYITSVDEQKIEDIFVLYGYRMNLTYNIKKELLNNDIVKKNYKNLKESIGDLKCV